MKISEMTNDQATNTLIRLAQPISNILDDEEMGGLLKEFSGMEGLGYKKAIAKLLPKVATIGLKNHRTDFYEIIGALGQIPTGKVGGMKLMETLAILRDSIDRDFLDFIESFGSQARTAEGE